MAMPSGPASALGIAFLLAGYVVLLNDGSPSSSCDHDVPEVDPEGCAVLLLDSHLLNLAAAKAREQGLA